MSVLRGLVVAAFLSVCAITPASAAQHRTFTYGHWPHETGVVFNPHAHRTVVFVHGGGWTIPDATPDALRTAAWIAETTGWRVLAVNYPTTPVHELPVRVVEPRAIRQAIKYAGGKVDVWGESAGGHLALLAAYRHPRHVRAVVSIAGPADMRTTYTYDVPNYGTNNLVERFEQALPTERRRYARTSPDALTSKIDPPTYQAISTTDPAVPALSSEQLRDALTANRVPNRLDEVVGSDHPPTLERDKTASGGTVRRAAVRFLRTH